MKRIICALFFVCFLSIDTIAIAATSTPVVCRVGVWDSPRSEYVYWGIAKFSTNEYGRAVGSFSDAAGFGWGPGSNAGYFEKVGLPTSLFSNDQINELLKHAKVNSADVAFSKTYILSYQDGAPDNEYLTRLKHVQFLDIHSQVLGQAGLILPFVSWPYICGEEKAL